jgi:hypothetical protein
MRKLKKLYKEYLNKVIKVQRWVRRMIKLEWLSPNMIKRNAATMIQKYIRGYIVDKYASIVFERTKLARILEENNDYFSQHRL